MTYLQFSMKSGNIVNSIYKNECVVSEVFQDMIENLVVVNVCGTLYIGECESGDGIIKMACNSSQNRFEFLKEFYVHNKELKSLNDETNVICHKCEKKAKFGLHFTGDMLPITNWFNKFDSRSEVVKV